MSLSVTLPTPQGIIAGPFPWYQLVARQLSFLPLPSLTEPPPDFWSTARASLPAIQAGEKVLAQSRHRSQKSRHILAWNARDMPPACTCYLNVFSIAGLELQQLDCRLSQNILSQYMSGFMKTVLTSAQPPWQFSKKLQGIFQSINHRQPDNTQCTHPACLWLAGWLPATKPTGHDWQRLSYKQNKQFCWAKCLSLWPSPPPRG